MSDKYESAGEQDTSVQCESLFVSDECESSSEPHNSVQYGSLFVCSLEGALLPLCLYVIKELFVKEWPSPDSDHTTSDVSDSLVSVSEQASVVCESMSVFLCWRGASLRGSIVTTVTNVFALSAKERLSSGKGIIHDTASSNTLDAIVVL